MFQVRNMRKWPASTVSVFSQLFGQTKCYPVAVQMTGVGKIDKTMLKAGFGSRPDRMVGMKHRKRTHTPHAKRRVVANANPDTHSGGALCA